VDKKQNEITKNNREKYRVFRKFSESFQKVFRKKSKNYKKINKENGLI